MQSLAFNYGTLIEAQNSLPENSGIDLAELVQQNNKLAEAWQRAASCATSATLRPCRSRWMRPQDD